MPSADENEMLVEAMSHHRLGRFAQAEALYRQSIDRYGESARSLHLLGMSQFQQERPAEGLKHVERSIAIAPNLAATRGHLGLILSAIGRVDDAIAAYRAALQLDPTLAEAWNNLGAALTSKGDSKGAMEAFRSALRHDPAGVMGAVNLGQALTREGNFREAADVLRGAMARQPGDVNIRQALAAAVNNIGAQLTDAAKPQEALEVLKEAIELDPQLNEGWLNYANALHSLQRWEESIAAYQRTLSIKWDNAAGHNNLGIALATLGRLDQAIAHYRIAIQQNPRQSLAFNNLANALNALGNYPDAERAYRQALAIAPDSVEPWNNLGVVLMQQRRFAESTGAFERAIQLRPAFSEAYNNLGNVRKELGDIPGAVASYERAIEMDPDNQSAQSNRLYTLYFHESLSPREICDAHRKWNRDCAARFAPANPPVRGRREGRLRIGYVGAYFREHCQSFFTYPLLRHHDRTAVEVIVYSDSPRVDAVTGQLRAVSDQWHQVFGMTDDALAERVKRDGIDILVDLTLHMSANRMLLFARRPAPLAVTWLGYPGTTGLETIDYRFTDPHLDPPDAPRDGCYTEKSFRLPHTFWCYDPLTDSPSPGSPPGARNGYITFGSLNNYCKVNGPTLLLWAQVMRAMPTSRLLLMAPADSRRRVTEALAAEGIDPGRIEFVDRMSRALYLEAYQRIDIGLETIPYNGHTTTLDALWMGVPVITLVGDTPVGRAGWSQLSNLGLTDLAADSTSQYVEFASALCGDMPRLSQLRRTLRARMRSSPLMDGALFARGVEAAYRAMWEQR